MKFLIARTSNMSDGENEPPAPGATRTEDGKAWQIEFATLEDLCAMITTLDEPLILSRRNGPTSLVAIEIYDDMREEF